MAVSHGSEDAFELLPSHRSEERDVLILMNSDKCLIRMML